MQPEKCRLTIKLFAFEWNTGIDEEENGKFQVNENSKMTNTESRRKSNQKIQPANESNGELI